MKISERADVSLREAVVRKDEELVEHEFTKISIALARIGNFRVEVEGCVGEASQYTGETIVDLVIDEQIRTDDPSGDDIFVAFDAVESDRPAAVTGSR